MTKEQMTEKMVNDLKLDEKRAKKVTKLNKKFKTLIEGEQQNNMKGQRPPMGQGRPDGNRGGGRPGGGFGSGMPGGGMGMLPVMLLFSLRGNPYVVLGISPLHYRNFHFQMP